MSRKSAAETRAKPLARSEYFDLENSIPYLIYRITARLNQDIHARLKPAGISLPRWRILASLSSRGRSTVKELATCTVMKHAVVSKVLKEMEDDGLITRTPSQSDLRAVNIELTDEGIETLKVARRIAGLHRDIALRDLTPANIETLLGLLKQIQKNLGIVP